MLHLSAKKMGASMLGTGSGGFGAVSIRDSDYCLRLITGIGDEELAR